MKNLYLTREFTFEAAHSLNNYTGECSNTHGHSYKLQVTIKGEPDHITGLLIDFKLLKNIINDCIIYKLDHKNLNDLNNLFENINTTVENLCYWAWYEIMDCLPNNIALHKVRIWETQTCYATYYGGK